MILDKDHEPIQIYTDGACSGNPGPGGWAAILVHCDTEKIITGGEGETTNNRMEMMAAIAGLEVAEQIIAKRGVCQIRLTTDSKYLCDGITKWITGWRAKNWKTAGRKDVKNKDLWCRVDTLNQRLQIEWAWVRGHDGHEYNERADQLARDAVPQN